MACFVWDSPHGRVVFDLDRAIVIVGSDSTSDFCIRAPSVSSPHALIQVDGDQVKITDLGSDRGTRINGASLVPDLPSTLEAGDFVSVGKVVLTFHRTPPPAAAAPPRKPKAAASSTSFPWKWVAIGLAFLLVGSLGVLIAMSVRGSEGQGDEAKSDKPTEPQRKADPAPQKESGKQDPAREPDAKPVEKEAEVILALPPNRYAAVEKCPNLVEAYDVGFIPAKVESWDAGHITAVGADGKRYRFKRNETYRVVDRADLARRARKRIERQPIEEIKNCFELAQWCFLRHIRAPLKPFLKRILADRPGDPVKRLLETIEAEEKEG